MPPKEEKLKTEAEATVGQPVKPQLIHLALPFLNVEVSSKDYYNNFGRNVVHFESFHEGRLVCSATCLIKDFYREKEASTEAALIVTNIRTENSREAFVKWVDELLPRIRGYKKENALKTALFVVSKRQKNVFEFFVNPRRTRSEDLRFNYIKSLNLDFVQGRKFFSEEPLEHIKIRRAQKEDLVSVGGFIKRASQQKPLARNVGSGALEKEFADWKGLSEKDMALAFDSKGKIVGTLACFDPQQQLSFKSAFDEVKDAPFLVTQKFLKVGSWLQDLRPVRNHSEMDLNFFTHLHVNNKDILYSLICWWFEQSKKSSKVFLLPRFRQEYKHEVSSSLFTSSFGAELYLFQEPGEEPSELLKPKLRYTGIDLDLPLFI